MFSISPAILDLYQGVPSGSVTVTYTVPSYGVQYTIPSGPVEEFDNMDVFSIGQCGIGFNGIKTAPASLGPFTFGFQLVLNTNAYHWVNANPGDTFFGFYGLYLLQNGSPIDYVRAEVRAHK